MTSTRVAIYARVSTADVKTKNGKKTQQDPEVQLAQLRAWCAKSGHEIVTEYVERESGTKGTDSRKQLSALLSDAHQRQFDLVLFWSLDRFSREGMAKTVSYLQRLDAAGVTFHSFTEPWLCSDNELVNDLLISIMASLAKQQAIKISENTKAGLARARAAGKTLGRPQVPAKKLKAIAAEKAAKPELSVRALARQFKVSRRTVEKALDS